jgi:hypothetical protein
MFVRFGKYEDGLFICVTNKSIKLLPKLGLVFLKASGMRWFRFQARMELSDRLILLPFSLSDFQGLRNDIFFQL